MMKNKSMIVPALDFKLDESTGIFTAYANTKNVVDKAQDRAVDGCYTKSINNHLKNGTMPKMFWSHNPYELPVGAWHEMSEDKVGLKMSGKISKTTMGKDIEVLAKDKALDSFSIGYQVISEKWNTAKNCNDLIEIDIKEVSWVNFACNEHSLLQDIKSHLSEGQLPTKRELQQMLRHMKLSKSQAEAIVHRYNDKPIDEKALNLSELTANLQLFQ